MQSAPEGDNDSLLREKWERTGIYPTFQPNLPPRVGKKEPREPQRGGTWHAKRGVVTHLPHSCGSPVDVVDVYFVNIGGAYAWCTGWYKYCRNVTIGEAPVWLNPTANTRISNARLGRWVVEENCDTGGHVIATTINRHLGNPPHAGVLQWYTGDGDPVTHAAVSKVPKLLWGVGSSSLFFLQVDKLVEGWPVWMTGSGTSLETDSQGCWRLGTRRLAGGRKHNGRMPSEVSPDAVVELAWQLHVRFSEGEAVVTLRPDRFVHSLPVWDDGGGVVVRSSACRRWGVYRNGELSMASSASHKGICMPDAMADWVVAVGGGSNPGVVSPVAHAIPLPPVPPPQKPPSPAPPPREQPPRPTTLVSRILAADGPWRRAKGGEGECAELTALNPNPPGSLPPSSPRRRRAPRPQPPPPGSLTRWHKLVMALKGPNVEPMASSLHMDTLADTELSPRGFRVAELSIKAREEKQTLLGTREARSPRNPPHPPRVSYPPQPGEFPDVTPAGSLIGSARTAIPAPPKVTVLQSPRFFSRKEVPMARGKATEVRASTSYQPSASQASPHKSLATQQIKHGQSVTLSELVRHYYDYHVKLSQKAEDEHIGGSTAVSTGEGKQRVAYSKASSLACPRTITVSYAGRAITLEDHSTM